MCRKIKRQQAIYFREQFRNARVVALENAESFQDILFTVEKLGSYLYFDGKSLGDYKLCITGLALKSDLLTCEQSVVSLYDIIKDARNDALHQGAFARHLTQNAVKLSLILEDALEKYFEDGEEKLKVEDFMVSDVIRADLWKPLAFIRQQMLANSFSYLPFFDDDKKRWFLISDYQLTNYLRSVSKTERKTRLAEILENFYKSPDVTFEEVESVNEDSTIEQVLKTFEKSNGKPALILNSEKVEYLIGIITPFDLL